jgi:hypothetical protein
MKIDPDHQAPGSDHSQDYHTVSSEPGDGHMGWFWPQVGGTFLPGNRKGELKEIVNCGLGLLVVSD